METIQTLDFAKLLLASLWPLWILSIPGVYMLVKDIARKKSVKYRDRSIQ